MKHEEKTIYRGIGFRIYTRDERYFIDEHKGINHSWETLEGLAEHCYYMGYIPTKDVYHLININFRIEG